VFRGIHNAGLKAKAAIGMTPDLCQADTRTILSYTRPSLFSESSFEWSQHSPAATAVLQNSVVVIGSWTRIFSSAIGLKAL